MRGREDEGMRGNGIMEGIEANSQLDWRPK
jgi:hypothetical protein